VSVFGHRSWRQHIQRRFKKRQWPLANIYEIPAPTPHLNLHARASTNQEANMIRGLMVVVALAGLAGCGPGTVKVSAGENDEAVAVASVGANAKGDYNLQVFAAGEAKIYLMSGPAGKTVAARAADGQSAIMPVADAQALLEKHTGALAATPTGGETVKIQVPFLGIDVVSDESGDNAKVRINAGGQKVEVDANDAADLAHVRVSGVDAASARDFINDAEGLSAETKAEMLKSMGL
jgi:hypothetical protein